MSKKIRVGGPYQVTEADVDRSSTLEWSDVGRWALNVTGCVQLFDTREAAAEAKRYLEEP